MRIYFSVVLWTEILTELRRIKITTGGLFSSEYSSRRVLVFLNFCKTVVGQILWTLCSVVFHALTLKLSQIQENKHIPAGKELRILAPGY